jgi:hypothetical protein
MTGHNIVVRPVRFTDGMPKMRGFLEALGLRARVESERGGWVDIVAGAGMVALHSAAGSDPEARDGETRLSFEGLDLGALADQLSHAGFPDATVWDEAYGRVLSVTGPLGDQIWVDGYNDGNYGLRVHEPQRDARLSVMAVRFADPAGPMSEFLKAFGLSTRSVAAGERGGIQDFAVYEGHTGLVALHSGRPETRIIAGPGAVQLGFETRQPLADLAIRLTKAGHRDAMVRPLELGEVLYVTHPDGQPVVVLRAPSPDSQ